MKTFSRNRRFVFITTMAVVGLFFAMKTASAQTWGTVTNNELFKTGYLQVVGESEAGQSRFAATRAAKVVAQADLLEQIQGVHVQGGTTVQAGMLSSSEVKARVEGFLKGAHVCGKKYHSPEGYAEVCLRVYLNGAGGIYDSLYPTFRDADIFSEPSPSPSPFVPSPGGGMVQAAHDGVIIEMGGLAFKPAIINRILDEKGEILFDPSNIVNAILVERGTGGYTNQLGKAKGLLASWGSTDPLIIKAVSTKKGTDVVIASMDATKMFAADRKSSFLSQAKVVFVIN